jgi:nucleotide-binding universal stress UspA family protein
LQRAGLHREGEALVVSVAESWLRRPLVSGRLEQRGSAASAASAVQTESDLEIAWRHAREAQSRLKSHFSLWTVEALAVSGSPAREILNKASEWQAELVALGCQGSSAMGRFLLGSVSQKVVHEAECSVRICRGTGWKTSAPVRILMGVDGSLGAEEAVKAVAGRSWPLYSEVRLVTVIDPTEHGASTNIENPDDSWIRPVLDSAESQLRAVELNVSSKIEVGDPKHILVASADEWGADCIVLGAGKSPSQFSLGSVSTAVVARGRCSVEVIRARKMMSSHQNESTNPPGG